ncbi:MAG: hypothetical protein HY321_21890 [Armatimonadetes bacterium]|nr:hypothetical protein [Armatimonadota bacterium]
MDLRLVHISGEPYEMGRQHGRMLRDEVRALAEERVRLVLSRAASAGHEQDRARCLALAARYLPAYRAYSAAGYEEFRGIADGAGISQELLLISTGYTDYVDVSDRGTFPEECTALWVRPEAAGGRTLCGQTWDMHASVEPFAVLLHRKPNRGPATLSLTTAGCPSLFGINAAGIAVGTNNLKGPDARPGVVFTAMIHEALAADSFEAAVAALTDAPRASGHNYYVADADGRVCDVETTAEHAVVLQPEGHTFAHANHYTAPGLASPVEALAASSSPVRERRMRALLAAGSPPYAPEDIHRFLSDHEGGARSICVHNTTPDGGKSCGMVLFCPQTREMWVRLGNPCEGPLQHYALGNL